MYVLGINSYLHDASAALMHDGRLVFAAEEERFTRVKKDARFPRNAIQASLRYAGMEFGDLDAVAFGWNQGGVTPLYTLKSVFKGDLPFTAPYVGHSLLTVAREVYHGNGKRSLQRAFGDLSRLPVLFIDHHESHAWSAYAPSGMDEALVLVMDGRGARESTTLYHARGESLRRVKRFDFPNSLGIFYEAFTDLLGFERNNDEWKVMGLAAYGEPTYDLSDILRVTDHGYELDTRLVCGNGFNDLSRMVRRFGERRQPEVRITEDDMNLAASVQKTLEDAFFSVVREGIRLTGCRDVCIAGGVAMNSKANGRLLASGLIRDLFVQPAATDDGAALGAAIGAHKALGQAVPRTRMEEVYLGPEYSEAEVESVLKTYKLAAQRVEDVEVVTARLLAEGNIVGWFQGRLEFGPRALGNRSILADPHLPEMKDRVNESIKFRESWRPFAPSCLEEVAPDYFVGCTEAPFMIVTFDVVPERRSMIPAVTHADNTARVQTVSATTNPRYWRLIDEFGKLTGVPVIMNTSFNLRGEPIVCSPSDAVRTFYSSGLDFLVLGDYVVPKDPHWDADRITGLAASAR